jgi:hypothetical protein
MIDSDMGLEIFLKGENGKLEKSEKFKEEK